MSLLQKLFNSKKNEPDDAEKKSTGTVIREKSLGVEKKQQAKSPESVAKEQKNLEPITFELDEEEKWKIGRVLINEYKVEKYLGEGGMGTVYMLVQREMDNQPFAVKTLLASALKDEQRRRLFLQELRTWMDLPDHPNLTACRFFRTIEGRLAIFAEYVDGGSLRQWIRNKKLLKLEQILDVAIQFAWGLQEAHDHNVIHQDVKPANVLMTKDGIAKITDFGLASARNAGRIEFKKEGEPTSNLVSVHGMTEAYCSPEQASWKELDHKTDIWSWGLSILEMFTGSVTWQIGSIANHILEDYTKKESCTPYPKMPNTVVEVLRKCFKENPEERWNTLDEVAEQLQKIYKQETGKPYFREKPKTGLKITGDEHHDRRTLMGINWDDPVKWLNKAFQATNMDLTAMDGMIPERRGSRKAQALVDLEIYKQAETIYMRSIENGRKELERDLIPILFSVAIIQENIDDKPGSLETNDKILKIYERLVYKEGRIELLHELGRAYFMKGVSLFSIGEFSHGSAMFDKSIEILERLVYKEGRMEHWLLHELAEVYHNKGGALWALGENRQAVTMFEKAIGIRERFREKDVRPEQVNDLAGSYMAKGLTLKDLGKNRQAIKLFDKSIEIRERLVNKENHIEMRHDLALAYSHKVGPLWNLRKYRQADAMCDNALEIFERLVCKEGRTELMANLAIEENKKGNILIKIKEYRQADAMFNNAIEIFEKLVYKEGLTALTQFMGLAYKNKGKNLKYIGDTKNANIYLEKAERIINKK